MPEPSAKQQKLLALLRELFQLDQPDLDFGLYRIMHAKAREIEQFLNEDLLAVIQQRLGGSKAEKVAQAKTAYERERQNAIDYGGNPDTAPKAMQALAEYKAAQESADDDDELFDQLYRFFERYYDGGDFLSRRYYGRGESGSPYAVPYDGSEVYLHWANKDQYYIKSSENFRQFSVDLVQAKLGELFTDDTPRKLHFAIVDAQEGEHGNVKGTAERYFIADESQPLEWNNGELTVRFHYRADDEKTGQASKWREERNTRNEQAILAALKAQADEQAASYAKALASEIPKGKDKTQTLLAKYLNQYTAKNSMDYFIHKDLGGFLKRELDYYIKNEVLKLDDLGSADAPNARRLESILKQTLILRDIAHKLITFLAQTEDFQKKLWLKKKFVVDTHWLVTLDKVPAALYPAIKANDAQWAEWVNLGFVEANADRDALLTAESKLVLDTSLFEETFTAQLIASIPDLDEATDGVLVHSENFQALNLMQERYREQVKCIYIDPPYNTGSDGFTYKDTYKHSSWMCMLLDRLTLTKLLLMESSAIATSINDLEIDRLINVCDDVYGRENHVSSLIWNTEGHTDNQYEIKVNHEYIQVYARDLKNLKIGYVIDPNTRAESNLWKGFAENSITKNGAANPCSVVELPIGFPVEVATLDLPASKLQKEFFEQVEKFGYITRDLTKKFGASYPVRLDHMLAADNKLLKPCRVLSGWASVDKLKEFIQNTCQPVKEDGDTFSYYLSDRGVIYYHKQRSRARNIYSVLKNMGTTEQMRSELEGMGLLIPGSLFPKPKQLLGYLLQVLSLDRGIALDYFAGSGTTGHAVLNLNREDGGKRKYILVEMGDYFDTVLKPRIAKVVYSKDWKDGKPTAPETGISQLVKVIRLESYEDTLNNLRIAEELPLRTVAATDANLKQDYFLHYLLELETAGSPSLLDVAQFADPTGYHLNIKKPGSEAQQPTKVDLVETFNWLLGLRVSKLGTPQTFRAEFVEERDEELGNDAASRVVLRGVLQAGGDWWFRTVQGVLADGKRVWVVWRKLTADPVRDNLVLEAYLREQLGFDVCQPDNPPCAVLFVNGSHALPVMPLCEVRQLEEAFHRLMWDVQDGH